MRREVRNAITAFERVQQFITQHPLADAPDSLGAQADELETVVNALTVAAVDQDAGVRLRRAHVESQKALCEQLYVKHIRPISLVAREVFGITGMDRAFRMPVGKRVSQVVLTAAEAMAQAAEKSKDVFVQHALPPDFIEQLRGAATALEEARNSKTDSIRRQVSATASAQDLVKRGRKAVRLLDAILVPRYSADPDLLAAWRSAKKVRPSTFPPATTEVPAAPSVTTEKAA